MDKVITDVRDLPSISDMGLLDSNLIQITCQRNVSGENFVLGTQD